MSEATTIKLFLPKGDAKSIRIVEILNWSGKGIAAPRTEIHELLARTELEQSGIYILLGNDPVGDEPMAYIGQTKVLKERLKIHVSSKNFWEQAIVFVGKDENLTKAHIQYLESMIIKEAMKTGKIKLDNCQSSNEKLPEADRHDMENFFKRIKQLLPILGSELLSDIPNKDSAIADNVLYFSNKNHVAMGNRTNNGFVIYRGSEMVLEMQPTGQKMPKLVNKRDQFQKDGTIIINNGKLVFTKDIEFSSPSSAASIICGGSANGLTAWKDKEGRTLKELEVLSLVEKEKKELQI